MRKFCASLCFALLPGALLAGDGFDPHQPCYKLLSESDSGDQLMIAAWTFGYIAAIRDDARPVDIDNATTMLGNLTQACINDSQKSLYELVAAAAPAPQGPGSKADAEAFLARFIAPGADLVALTAEILPSEADVRAVYEEPLASKLVAMYAGAIKPGMVIGPKAGQSRLRVVRTTTDRLIAGDPVLRDFPGGYERVRQYMKPGFPIVAYEFLEPGKELGYAIAGLSFIEGRWVLLPKPWRALE